ncbi:hypothetical protein SERLADRAFT_460305, partial [Serpula lacrymans var. lacrymans S7.9]
MVEEKLPQVPGSTESGSNGTVIPPEASPQASTDAGNVEPASSVRSTGNVAEPVTSVTTDNDVTKETTCTLPGSYPFLDEELEQATESGTYSETAAQVVGTMRGGTSSAVQYIAAGLGLGAASENSTGESDATKDKVPVEEPTSSTKETPSSTSEHEPESAPTVPMSIVPLAQPVDNAETT